MDFNEDNVLFPGPSGTARGSEHPGGKDAKVSESILVHKTIAINVGQAIGRKFPYSPDILCI